MEEFDLRQHGLAVRQVHRNLAPSRLYEEAIRHERGTTISDTGALIAYSGESVYDRYDLEDQRGSEPGAP